MADVQKVFGAELSLNSPNQFFSKMEDVEIEDH
jgi:hypothetical protein